MKKYDVIDLREEMPKAAITIEAHTPEGAVATALGLEVVRSGPRSKLCARVYWTNPGQPRSMVRLYTDQIGKGSRTV